jgi:trimethylamine--corrinoid protein Co-methyltransferase
MRTNSVFRKTLGFDVFSRDQCEELHLASLEVLDSIGVRVHDDGALGLLHDAGARVENDLVRVPAWMVQEALATVPCRVPVGSRDGKRAMLLEKGRSYFGSGSDTQTTYDILTGERRSTVKEDVANAARIVDALEHIDFVMSMAIASDVPVQTSFLHQFEAMVMNTTKPIIYTADGREDVEDIIEISEIVAGSPEALRSNPFIILYAEPSSPLQHSQTALQKLLLCAEKGMPVMYIPTVMLGASGPVTSAGSIVIANAEILSGLVIHQLKSRGAPFIYGGSAPSMDMRTTICTYGSPEAILNDAAIICMSRYYNLPDFCTGGCTDSQVFDQQAAAEAAYGMLLLGMAGGTLIHDLGYMGSGMTSSLELLVLTDEVASMVRRTLEGVEVSPVTLAMDVIRNAGPGGNFLTEAHTLDNFRQHLHFSNLLNRQDYDNWKREGGVDFGMKANQKARDILETHRAAELSPEIARGIAEVLKRREHK